MSSPVKKWNQYGRKHFGKYITMLGTSAIALFPVWMCNGLWHGARWSYIFYGMYYFSLILVGISVEPVRDRILKILHISPEFQGLKYMRIAKTWVIIFVGNSSSGQTVSELDSICSAVFSGTFNFQICGMEAS